MGKIIYEKESYRIIGACFEVYNQLGSGFSEQVYQNAFEYCPFVIILTTFCASSVVWVVVISIARVSK